jgi:single-strand DNA-binding protein
VAIESTTKEEPEMGRTSKPAGEDNGTAVVELHPENHVADVVELQPGTATQWLDQPVDIAADAEDIPVDDQPEADAPQEPTYRSRGPALNRVELIGRICKAPDLRATQTGMYVAFFRLATNGRDEKDTEFHQCKAFGKTAEFIGQYLGTGRLVYLDGRLQTRTYDDPDGVRRRATTIIVNRLQALDSRRNGEQADQ